MSNFVQSPPSALTFTSGGFTFDLMAPVVTSYGKVYYWLDLSRDGSSQNDTLTHDSHLDPIFNFGSDTTVTLSNRSFEQSGYKVVLPTYQETLALVQDKNSQQPSAWGGYYLLADIGGSGHRDAIFNYATMTGSAANSWTQESAPGGAIVEVIFVGSTTQSSQPICFARGTHIQIGDQSKPVEALSISNQVSTKTASAAIKWIGYQRRTPEFAQFQDYLPVKISAGALDDNLPLRDLYLSPDHAVLVDGHLIHAKALVNGKTIVQTTQWTGDIEFYHIETETHEIIYAEGVPCETFIDNVSREQFDNYAEYQALYPNTRMMKELRLPRVRFKRQLPESIRERLESRIDELDRQHSLI